MGNYVSRRNPAAAAAAGKVVLSDGTVKAFDPTASVAELMLEHPQQFVVDLHSLLPGTTAKPTPLPADHRLDPDRAYLMLPMKHGKPSKLSAGETRQVLSRARSLLRPRPFSKITRLAAPRRGEGVEATGEGGASEEGTGKMGMPGFSTSEAFGEVPPAFLSRQLSGHTVWKPTLHTIEEKALQRKLPHWLF